MPAFTRLIAGQLSAMFRTARARGQLAAMDDRMLSDLGISRADALAEGQRQPWDYMPLRSPPKRPKLRVVVGGRAERRPAGSLRCQAAPRSDSGGWA